MQLMDNDLADITITPDAERIRPCVWLDVNNGYGQQTAVDLSPDEARTLAARLLLLANDLDPVHGQRIRSHSDLAIHEHNADPDCPFCAGTGLRPLTVEETGSLEEWLARDDVPCACTEPPTDVDHEPASRRDRFTDETFDDVAF